MTNDELISLEQIYKAKIRLKEVVLHTPLMPNHNLSERFQCKVLLKREDLQVVRSYKIRGAYNRMSAMTAEELERGIVCASAGNHAQGVALACNKIGVHGHIFMPSTTSQQKVEKVQNFGKSFVEIVLFGDTFDEANAKAIEFSETNNRIFIPPFNDRNIIAGQATVGLEVLEDSHIPIEYVFVAIGGGGLELIDALGLVENARATGAYLNHAMAEAIGGHPHVGEVRGAGLLCAVEFVEDKASRTFFDAAAKVGPTLAGALAKKGVIARAMPEGDILGYAPPLCLSKEEADQIVAATRAVVEAHFP